MLSESLLAKDNSKKKMGSKQPRLIPSRSKLIRIFSIIFVVFIFYSSLRTFVKNDERQLLRDDFYWKTLRMYKQKIQTLHPPGTRNEYCLTSGNLHETELNQLNSLFEYFNHDKTINYFMCFSSLYFTAKSEEYNVYKVAMNGSHYETEAMKHKNQNKKKCIETEFDCTNMDSKSTSNNLMIFESKIHLCVLNEDSSSICLILTSNFNKNLPANANKLNCNYNMWNGEYTLTFDDSRIKLIIHEYEPTFKLEKSIQLSFWKLQSWWTYSTNRLRNTEKSRETLKGEVTLRQGFVELFFGHENFNMPSFFFYEKTNKNSRIFNYISYLNTPIRLPADVINYFMIFYENIWYN